MDNMAKNNTDEESEDVVEIVPEAFMANRPDKERIEKFTLLLKNRT